MANVLRDQRLFIGALNLSCAANSVALETEVEEKDRTAICDTARRRRAGLKSGSIGANGFFDAAAHDAALFAMTGLSGVPVGVTAPDVAEGGKAWAMQAMSGQYNPVSGSVGDLAEFTLSALGDGPLVMGKVALLRDVTASGIGPVIQLPSVQAGRRLYAAVFVHALSAGAELDVLIRSASAEEFTSPVTRISIDEIDAASGLWREWGGESAHQYWRPSWTLTGAEASASIAIILAVQ